MAAKEYPPGEEPFRLTRSAAFVLAYPRGYCDPTIPISLIHYGLQPQRFFRSIHRENPVDVAYNLTVRAALANPKLKDCEWFVFADNDMGLTTPGIKPWLAAEEDVVGIMYELGPNNRTWGRPDAFHAGMWRGRRKVLEAIGPPWFKTILSADGCRIETCCCEWFARKVKTAGYSLGKAGWADHGSNDGHGNKS